eukprot:CAMPEP_0204531032 /NCGR_PEP_ID=MMETSP0661-20131031/10951_1 /ASSEMBLY_ACC=CAM_ASM_000606 /TAXON_ID=109239 /ORGANISM="Alexandrium margalefi, Strain AMGDE01CS-322" /LENGTH=328 /DNA_ID=CAMNT_0051537161 /DNA_START=57 /DNA_END=1043 /DNA_ORIENTATION=-
MSNARQGLDLQSLGAASNARKQAKAIAELKLERYALELEMNGLTVLPPEVTGITPEQCGRMVELLLARAEELVGVPFSLEVGPTEEVEYSNANVLGMAGQGIGGEPAPKLSQIQLVKLAQLHREFRDLAVHPAALALVRHMVGYGATRLSSTNSFIKWRGGGYGANLGMHCDQATPLPWGHAALNANVNWLLTDYTKEGGAFAYVPGSHRRHMPPVFPAAVMQAVPVEARRGSAVVFHGQLWHGAFPKLTGGLRVTVSNYFRHSSVQPQEDLPDSLPRELTDDCSDPKAIRQLAGFGGAPYKEQPKYLLVRSARKGAGPAKATASSRL